MEAATGDSKAGTEGLESELSELLDQETFEPPGEFRERALVADESLHEEAARDPEAWWLKLAAELDWFTEPTTGLDDSDAAVLQVVRRRQDQRLLQLPRPPRRGRQRRPGRLPLARGGGRGGRGHLRRPAPRRPAARERAARPRRRGRRRRRHLPADDPRGRGGDARLRPDRRPAQRRLRRLLAGGGQGADAVLRGEGADHGRLRAAQGQERRDQAGGRRVPRRGALDRDRDRRPQHRRRGRDDRGTRRLLRRGARGRRPGVSAGRARRRAPALHPLLLGVDGEAEGDPAHHRRLSHRGRLDAPGTSST